MATNRLEYRGMFPVPFAVAPQNGWGFWAY